MATLFIGREKEKEILLDALYSDEAEMVSVIGRRRVGKTFLINTVYKNHITFKITGLQNATSKEQLLNFNNQLNKVAPNALLIQPPSSWLEAFFLLIKYLEQKEQKEKLVVFFDELPWLAGARSRFLTGLSYFWNSWAVEQNIVVVICGSAASWMIKKILKNKGDLHNRVTRRIQLKPFNLSETEEYLKSRKIIFDRYQLLQLYMAMGGVPHYLKEIKGGKSAIQNIDSICFSETGLLKDEFLNLYNALFSHPDNHVAIIRALASKNKGMSRKEIVEYTRVTDGGRTTRVLEELEQSGFISSFYPFGKKKKDKLYRLMDEYSLFYLKFIEKNIKEGEGTWETLSQTQPYKSWSGYAFESICLKHVPQIKKALGISRVYSVSSSFIKKGNKEEQGTQIDLLIDRNDHIINLFEIKFYNTEFTINKSYAKKLRNKIGVFQESTKTKKQIFLSIISTFGIIDNIHSIGLVIDDLDMNSLFEK